MKIKHDMLCMTEGCDGKPICRKLCQRCYYRLLRRVQRDTATWGGLVNAGECSPAKRYHGMTTAVRRRNAIAALDCPIKPLSREENMKRLFEIGQITEGQYQKFLGNTND